MGVAKKLTGKYKFAMLSNDIKDWSNFLRIKFEINRFFNVNIISGDVGYRKPDTKIYDILLRDIDSSAENCIFVDDKLENLQVASELGISTVRFVRKSSKVEFCSEFEISSFKELVPILENFY